MARVLIIDDDQAIAKMLAKMISKIDHQADFELTLKDGLKKAVDKDFDVIFLDVQMPDGSGLDAIKQLRARPEPPEVIIITGAGDPDGAELAINNGAWDYIQKPLSPKKIILPIKRVLEYRTNLKENRKVPIVLERNGLIGSGEKMQDCLKQLAMAAASEANVLITGETGTGKELFAQILHANSKRRDGTMVVVDCGALPESLVEGTLFGHVKGAFTGADRTKLGLVKMADKATLFLDEIGELSLSLQKSFLRVLQERTFRPVGSDKEVSSDFRLIAATNRDPDEMVANGQFRKDLLYRLRSLNVHLPPLRERLEDIGELLLYYTERMSHLNGEPQKGFSPEFVDVLVQYQWPGNIRELGNVVEYAVNAAGSEPVLFAAHLPKQLRIQVARASVKKDNGDQAREDSLRQKPSYLLPDLPEELTNYKNLRENVISSAEKIYFRKILAETDGSIKQACKITGLGRTRLYALLKKHDLTRTK